MQLHRASPRADWATVPASERNVWQRLAARSRGIVTPGNGLTVLGLILVFWGLSAIYQHHYWMGLGILVVGRACDLLDGWLAERTGTKSPLGEAMDVVADKTGAIITIGVFFTIHLAPWWVLVALILPQVIGTLIPVLLRRRQFGLHPSRAGKVGMAATWICMAGFVILQALTATRTPAGIIVYAVALAASLLGLYAYAEYFQRLAK